MMKSIILIAATAAFATAQITVESNGTITCPANKPNGNFCAADSLTTNIIIRCSNGKAQAGNCVDNLSGYPGNSALCYQSSSVAGDAACEKACVVHNEFGPFYTLSGCTTSTSSAVVGTSSISYSNATVTTTIPLSSSTTAIGVTTTSAPFGTNGTTGPSSSATTTPAPAGTGSATRTPVSPASTTSSPAQFTNGASSIQNWGAMVGAGLAIAYFL